MKKKTIEKMVDEVLDKAHIYHDVDIVDLCKKLGFAIYSIEKLDKDEDGFIIVKDKTVKVRKHRDMPDKLIAFNEDRTYEERRYIIAYQLARFLLSQKNNSIYAARGSIYDFDKIDHQLHYCASYLLMPNRVFENAYANIKARHKNKIIQIKALAECFEVPILCVLWRIEDLKD